MSRLYDAIGGFTTIPNTIIKILPEIGAEAFALFSYLRFRTNNESGVAFPGYDTIKKDTGLTYRKIARSLRKLESLKLLSRKKRFGNSSEYTLSCPSPLNGDRTVLHPLLGKSSQWGKTTKNDVTKKDITKSGDVKTTSLSREAEELFNSMHSQSEGMVHQEHTAAMVDPQLEIKAFVKEYAPRLSTIMGEIRISDESKRVARKIFYKKFIRDWLDARLSVYANGDGKEFREKSSSGETPTAYWILNRLDRERARRVEGNARNSREDREEEIKRKALSQ